MEIVIIAFLAVSLDALLGDPARIPHPIVAIGKLISKSEKILRKIFPKTSRGEYVAGIFLWVIVAFLSTGVPFVLLYLAKRVDVRIFWALSLFWCWQLLAAKSLAQAGRRVQVEVEKENLSLARKYVSWIVGRDTASLNYEQITKATVETIAENTSDGVIAPLFYMMIGGAPLAFLYKASNTLDSMVGYKNETYLHIGRFSARIDDVWNYIPARITGILLCASTLFTGEDARAAWQVYRRDHAKSTSPNAGHPESAVAGALGVELLGDAVYFGKIYHKEAIGDAKRPIEAGDIARTNRMMAVTTVLALLLFGGIRLLVVLTLLS